MRKKLKNRVLKLINSKPYKSFKAKEIARTLSIPIPDYPAFRNQLREMARQGLIFRFKKNRYISKANTPEVEGILHVNSKGYGFVVREDEKDVFISKKNMGAALHKDLVRVRLFAHSRGENPEGKVIRVVQRARTRLVGSFHFGRGYGYVIPDDLKIQSDILLDPDENMQPQEGEKVVVSIDEWKHEHLNPFGHIVEILGFEDEPGVDVLSIIYEFEIDTVFAADVVKAAESVSQDIPKAEIANRKDLRDLEVFTIDPEDAKDFDDAVSLQTLEDGTLRLGVHIADVSHYVSEKSSLDKEALQRGTSVYLVDRVVPMLPEYLSNTICSLVPDKDRLTYSVIIDFSPDVKVVHYEIVPSVIRSKKRYTYEEVEEIVLKNKKDPFAPTLKNMYTFSQTLRKNRNSVDLESIEVQVELDDKGTPVDIYPKARLKSHQLIEEFMLMANKVVARHVGRVLAKKHEREFPFVYRVHEKPDHEKLQNLVMLVRAFGFNIPYPRKVNSAFYKRLSDMFEDHPAKAILQNALIRSMMKAQYDCKNIGHFGLSFQYYTHFTSPIRRYPDLMVHRLLKRYASPPFDFPKEEVVESQCKHSNDMEVRAMEAERASVKLKQVEYMEKHVGDAFGGVISRILDFGVFVHIPSLLVDGLIHVSDLKDDYYVYEENEFSLKGVHSGHVYKLGDSIRVEVSRVSRNERIIDFVPVEKE